MEDIDFVMHYDKDVNRFVVTMEEAKKLLSDKWYTIIIKDDST